MKRLLLVQPPATKATEAPLSLAVLLESLRRNDVNADAVDANLGAYLDLLRPENLAGVVGSSPSTSVQRALKHLPESLKLLRSADATKSFERYLTAVRYLNLLLGLYGRKDASERLTLGDYQNDTLSMFSPADLEIIVRGEEKTLFKDYFSRKLIPQIKAKDPQLIAVSINYLNQALPAFELAGLLRRELPGVELIVGGGLLTSWKQALCQHGLQLFPFDRIVFGPGEASLLALAQETAGQDYFLEDDSMTSFVPDYSFAQLSEYFSPEPVLPLTTSRGCYWKKCLFCPEASAPVHPFCSAGPGEVADLMQTFFTTEGVKHFHLTDNAIPVRQLSLLTDAGEKLRGLNWYGFVRFEKTLEDRVFVQRLANSGCRMLQLGLESGSQVVLDRLQKGIDLESVSKILKNLKAAGITTYVYVMLGIPGETLSDAELTRSFLLRHAGSIDFLNLSIMNLPRDSELLENPEAHGIQSTELLGEASPLGLYQSFIPTSDWDRRAARRFLDHRLLKEPTIRDIVQRTPPWFTSNHAHFFGQKLA